ncbi:unnamed protein product [Acanthoscelides obtectus]|uniref:Uncharacterized protein n=1 Tax=Acanthoscelides obtectus TaxID=200917 RepID=A0A9P0M0P9_ACAOB|nr:unnamed protein product [Acanthoscelides obtectus]CAK1628414.1 hypothetical protein AOBTE_LOCUS5196 [Acanthoscelides obtectus]
MYNQLYNLLYIGLPTLCLISRYHQFSHKNRSFELVHSRTIHH